MRRGETRRADRRASFLRRDTYPPIFRIYKYSPGEICTLRGTASDAAAFPFRIVAVLFGNLTRGRHLHVAADPATFQRIHIEQTSARKTRWFARQYAGKYQYRKIETNAYYFFCPNEPSCVAPTGNRYSHRVDEIPRLLNNFVCLVIWSTGCFPIHDFNLIERSSE